MLGSGVYLPMAAVMAAGMTPPLAAGIASLVFRKRFTRDERESAWANIILGFSFITEGAIPFAAKDPFRAIPSFIAGSALAGAISMALGIRLMAPHGGIFVLAIPGVISNIFGYLIAIAAGTVLSCVLLGMSRKRI
jgi:PTS system fructose-specific IIC component